MVAFHITTLADQPSMSIGGYEPSLIQANADIYWTDIIKNSWWTVNLNGAKYDDYSFD